MKNFYTRFMTGFAAVVATLSLASGCATFQQHSAVVGLVVSQATMRYIEGSTGTERASRAARVVAIVEKIRPLVTTDSVSISQLASVAVAAIPSTLTPADRSLALSVINIASQELRNKVGEGVLKEDQVVTVRGVLDAIQNAALVYTGS